MCAIRKTLAGGASDVGFVNRVSPVEGRARLPAAQRRDLTLADDGPAKVGAAPHTALALLRRPCLDSIRSVLARWLVVAVTVLATPSASAAQATSAPRGATALCRDGSYSFSQHRSGTCSHHGGVAMWLDSRDTTAASPIVGDTAEQVGPACGIYCGTERWLVKTLSDPDRERVRLQPVDATVEELVALQRPAVLSPVGRAAPVELTVYRLEARLVSLLGEADGDYHLMLASPHDPTITMIAEVPDPRCSGACSSMFAGVYAKVRQQLMDRLNSPQSEARPLVRVTGVGFFDYLHGQRGVASNGIELHPVLDVAFP